MATTEEYSLSQDFDEGLNAQQLINEVNDNQDISTECVTVKNLNSDVVEIKFNGSLSSAEKAELDKVVADHVPYEATSEMTSVLVLMRQVTGLTGYITVALFPYSPSNMPRFLKMSMISRTTSSTYDIRVKSITTGAIIAERTFSNTNEDRKDLGPISNLPPTSDNFQVECRCNATLAVTTIKKIFLHHD